MSIVKPMHKRRLFYVPIYETVQPCDDEIKKEIIDWALDLHHREHDLGEILGNPGRTYDGFRKGYCTPVLKVEDAPEHTQPVLDWIDGQMMSIDESVVAYDYEVQVIWNKGYQILSNNTTGIERYTAMYVLDFDEEYASRGLGNMNEDVGEWRFLNPNNIARPLYEPLLPQIGQLVIMPSEQILECLPYDGSNERPRVTVLVNYITRNPLAT